MGAFQLPDDVHGDAAACLTYSFVCLLANCLLVWLFWSHHERTSYVAFIAYFTLLATVSSLIQQFYDYLFWRDILTEQFYYGQENAQDAEVQYQNGIYGLKLAMSYIRIFCIIVEGSLVFFFSLSLAATVYGWWAKNPRALRKMSTAGRVVPIALAILSIILLQTPFTHKSFTAYIVVANAQLIIALLGSSILLLMILFKYLQSRQQLRTWQVVQYAQEGSHSTTTTTTLKSRRSRAFSNGTSKSPNTKFDNWLVVRLTIAFLTLCVFEWTNVAPRISARRTILENLEKTAPDLSEKRAMATVTGYLSGVSPSMLAFLVFGTTKTFQQKIFKTFVPKALRRKLNMCDEDDFYTRRQRHASHLPTGSVRHSCAHSTTRAVSLQPVAGTNAMASPMEPPAIVVRRPSAVAQPGDPRGTSQNVDEPGCLWIDDASSRSSTPSPSPSQIGVAVTIPTFLKDDGDTDVESGHGISAPIPLSRFNARSSNNNDSSNRSSAGGPVVNQMSQRSRNTSTVSFAAMDWNQERTSKSSHGSDGYRHNLGSPVRGSESGDLRLYGGGPLSSNSTRLFYSPLRSGGESGHSRLGGGGPLGSNSSRQYYGTPRRGSEGGDLRLGRGGPLGSNSSRPFYGQPRRGSEGSSPRLDDVTQGRAPTQTSRYPL